mgnify:FL=1
MSKVYLVWYRLEKEKEDRIRGVAQNWQKAERMAKNLELTLMTSKRINFTFGVKSYELGGTMSFDLNDDGCHDRWTEEEFGEED